MLKSWAWKLMPYADLHLQTQSGLRLEIRDKGAWGCFDEIFWHGGYAPFFRHLDSINGWLDLGCNVGFFSLALLEHLRQRNPSISPPPVVLGDANEHCVAMARLAIENNGLTGRWDCRHVVVGPPGETVSFAQFRQSMQSGMFSRQRGEKTFHYRTTDLAALLGGLDTAIDLIKVDIEGAERFVFQLHGQLLERFRYGLCEWHAPHFDGAALRGWIERQKLELLEMRSQTAEGYDATRGDSWDSPIGMALWRNPACPG